jgi:hypothetical protein
MIKTVTTKAKDAIADATQRSAKGVSSVAGVALGEAAKVAAQVVLESAANALEAGGGNGQALGPGDKTGCRQCGSGGRKQAGPTKDRRQKREDDGRTAQTRTPVSPISRRSLEAGDSRFQSAVGERCSGIAMASPVTGLIFLTGDAATCDP